MALLYAIGDIHGCRRALERRGCDAEPVDPASDEGRLTLLKN